MAETSDTCETCIVCLGDLTAPDNCNSHQLQGDSTSTSDGGPSKIQDDPDAIAHLLPCGHNLHHDCLRPWVERATSCPICRADFNTVELCAYLTGPCISSYAVQEKRQEADFDPSVIVDDDLFDDVSWQPCLTCEEDTDEDRLLLCDGCNGAYHTYCIGLRRVPRGSWFCHFCQMDGIGTFDESRHSRGRPRTRGQQRRQGSRPDQQAHEWARVWQGVLIGTNIDLDFPFIDDDDQNERASAREINQLQRRLEVAERTSGATRFRDAASSILHARSSRRSRSTTPVPESQDEIRAWNAYDKVNQLRMNSPGHTGRKRKSATASPAEPQAEQPRRKLKRPRTRLPAESNDQQSASRGESSVAPQRRAANTQALQGPLTCPDPREGSPTFLQSLLKEVEMAPGSSNQSQQQQEKDNLAVTVPPRSGSTSPPLLSPGSSPSSSNLPSPRTRSLSPSRPGSGPPSPPPLSSRIGPIWLENPQYSPTSPYSSDGEGKDQERTNSSAFLELKRQHQYAKHPTIPNVTSNEQYSSRPANFKKEIQEIVTSNLKPLYRQSKITSEQYTNINRDISRQLYDRVSKNGCLLGDERDEIQALAAQEVERAVKTLERTTV